MIMQPIKTLLLVTVTASFAAAAVADDFYHGFAAGNPDFRSSDLKVQSMAGVQPSVGDSVDRYQGWAKDNPDLLSRFQAEFTDQDFPQIYPGQKGNPDL
jgi:hypothetical protein